MENTDDDDNFTLSAELDAIAKGHGYTSWYAMQAAAEAREIDDEEALALELIPRYADAMKQLPERTGAADGKVDLVGLPHDPDAARNFARMIRVLLFGYTDEEKKFLVERALDWSAKTEEEEARMEVLMAGLEAPARKPGGRP